MKPNSNFLLLVFASLLVGGFTVFSVYAQEESPTPRPTLRTPTATKVSTQPQPTGSDRLQKIKALKERVATRVAELKQQEKKVLGGKIKDLSDNDISLQVDDQILTLYVSADTTVASISASVRSKATLSSLSPGDPIAILVSRATKENTYDALTILARKTPEPLYNGKISLVDTGEGTFTFVSLGESIVADVETTTRTSRYDLETKRIIKSGLSKIRVGDLVHVMGTPILNQTSKIRASRILVIPALGAAVTATPTASPSISIKR